MASSVSLFPDGKGGRPARQGAVLAAGAAALPLLSYVMGGCWLWWFDEGELSLNVRKVSRMLKDYLAYVNGLVGTVKAHLLNNML